VGGWLTTGEAARLEEAAARGGGGREESLREGSIAVRGQGLVLVREWFAARRAGVDVPVDHGALAEVLYTHAG
jgi:hypothetical protein